MLLLLYLESPLNIKGQFYFKKLFLCYSKMGCLTSILFIGFVFFFLYFREGISPLSHLSWGKYRANFLWGEFLSVKRKSLKINLNSPNIHKCFKSKYQDPHIYTHPEIDIFSLSLDKSPTLAVSAVMRKKINKCTWSHGIVKLLEALLFPAR